VFYFSFYYLNETNFIHIRHSWNSWGCSIIVGFIQIDGTTIRKLEIDCSTTQHTTNPLLGATWN
jgi:hypothetical protein